MTTVRAFYRRQLRTLMSVDDLVDGLFTQMQTLDETRSTLAIFISDNGYMWGDHGLFNKRFPYTPSIKVPMFMRWPGHVTPGSKDDRMVANIDIAPTIMKATKITPPYPMDGRPLLGNHVRSRMLNEYFQDVDSRQIPTWASIRTARYQYIESYNKEPIGTSTQVYGRAGNQPIRFQEYYDLKKDPWQNHNILRDHHPGNDPDVGRLHRMLAHDRACSAKACP
jgi:arylsulfatase A-like enzyme